MTWEFNLGVDDKPYPYTKRLRHVKGRKRRKLAPKSTGDVMAILEAKYGVIHEFYENKYPQIDKIIMQHIKADIENQMAGGKGLANPIKPAMPEVEELFRKFIDKRQVEKLGIPGVPTEAALMGVRHVRGKKTTGSRRPSFDDTGLYKKSFRAWVE